MSSPATRPDLITIHVTPEMIRLGIAQSCVSCPIALAVNEILVDDVTAHVHSYISLRYRGDAVKLLLLGGHYKYIVDLPQVAMRWMRDFDCHAGDVPVVDFRFAVKRDQFIPEVLKEGI